MPEETIRHSDHRTLISGFWYTTTQINDVGRAWAEGGDNRLFIPSEEARMVRSIPVIQDLVDKTGIQQSHVDHLGSLPQYIMLPVNRGRNHWTSIAIAVNQVTANKVKVEIAFSDSMGNGFIPIPVRREMQRIASLFRHKYKKSADISVKTYEHRWHQPDGCSCGPYALKNAERFLAGKKQERNPGPYAIRIEQLNQMRNNTAYRGCSTNNEIDEILTHWLIDKIANKERFNITSNQDIEQVCALYAQQVDQDIETIRQKFIDEYGYANSREGTLRHLPVAWRIRELIQRKQLLIDAMSTKQRQMAPKFETECDKQLKLLRRENPLKKLDDIRVSVFKVSGDEIYSYAFMADLIDHIIKRNQTQIEKTLSQGIVDGQLRTTHLASVGQIMGSRKLQRDYDLKLIHLKNAYRLVAKAATKLKTVSIHEPREMLDEQIRLLQSAIARNNASFLMHIAYVLNDFCSAITEKVTFGWWKPDFKRLDEIENTLKKHKPRNLSEKDYKLELRCIEKLRDSKATLEKEAGITITKEDVETSVPPLSIPASV